MKTQKIGRKRKLSLFWRIYVYGLVLLLAVAVTAGIATHLARHFGDTPELQKTHKILATLMAAHVKHEPQGGDHLNTLLNHLYDMTHVSFSVFNNSGERIGQSGNLTQDWPEPKFIPSMNKHRFFLRHSASNVIIPLIHQDQ